MKNEWLPDWFDLKNYDGVKSMGLKEWAAALDSRSYVLRILDTYPVDKYPEARDLCLECIVENSLKPHAPFDSRPETFDPYKRSVAPLSVGHIGGLWSTVTFMGDGAELKPYFETQTVPEDTNLADKYQKLSACSYTELIDVFRGMDHQSVMDFDDFQGKCPNDVSVGEFVWVNIDAPDEKLFEDFKLWIKTARENKNISTSPQNFTTGDITEWYEKQVLPYIDLTTWAKLDNISLSYTQIGNVLFPDEYDVNLSDRIRRTVKPLTEKLLKPSTIGAIGLQSDMPVNVPVKE